MWPKSSDYCLGTETLHWVCALHTYPGTTAFILGVGGLWMCMEVFLNTAPDVVYHPPHNPMEKCEAFQFCFSLGKLSLGISILQVLQLSSWKFSFLPMLLWVLLLFWVGHRAWSLPLKVCLGSKLFCMFIREVKPRLHWCWASNLLLRFTPGFLAVAYLSMPVPISSLHTEW